MQRHHTQSTQSTQSPAQYLRQQEEHAQSAARKLRAKGYRAAVVPIIAQAAGQRVLVGYDVEVKA